MQLDLDHGLRPSEIRILPPCSSSGNDSGDECFDCRTPTSDEHRIPESVNCPPAPRKPKPPAGTGYKRKLERTEMRFVQIVDPDEVIAFFKRFDMPRSMKKRRQVL